MMKNLSARWLSEENIDGDEWEEREEDLNGTCEPVHKSHVVVVHVHDAGPGLLSNW